MHSKCREDERKREKEKEGREERHTDGQMERRKFHHGYTPET